MKSSVECISICYGDNLAYHRGVKFQILRAFDKFFSIAEPSLTVVTDQPNLFCNYPVKVIPISNDEKFCWSLNDQQHFGIKLKGLEKALLASKADACLLVDADMVWKKNPFLLTTAINDSSVVMYRNEGKIFDSRNASIKNFETSLRNKKIQLTPETFYSVSGNSEMWASNIIGIRPSNVHLVTEAYQLFSVLEHIVPSHTVEQFSLSEIFRINQISRIEANSYFSSWSNTGKKNYFSPLVNAFFEKYGEHEFGEHLKRHKELSFRRPARVFLRQKLSKFMG